MMNVRVNNLYDGNALAETAGSKFNPLLDHCIARVTPEGKLMGGAVFRNFTGEGGSINIHVASFVPRWINRTMMFMAADYVFNQLRVNKVFGNIPMKNAQALKFATDAGFKVETIIADVFPGDDMAVLSMYRDECPFWALAARPLGSETLQ
jgi:RimJ/RimL family protein N-acetyltransferase